MSRSKIEVNLLVCERCGHEWIARQIPKRCSKCKTPYWDSPRIADEKARAKMKPKPTSKPKGKPKSDPPDRKPVGSPTPSAVPISRECSLYAHGGCKTAGCPCTCHSP